MTLKFILVVQLLLAAPKAHAQTAAAPAQLRISGAVPTPLVLTVADLKKMHRKTLTVVNPHSKKTETYEGVLLEELLHKAGVAQGEHLRGPAMATYIIAGAEDGYRVVFSLAELDSGILESEVIVADTMDGTPLAAKEGPFRLVAPHEKRPARWVRMLKSITVVVCREEFIRNGPKKIRDSDCNNDSQASTPAKETKGSQAEAKGAHTKYLVVGRADGWNNFLARNLS